MPASALDRLVATAALFGTGIAVGMLLAPATGAATRRHLADSATAAVQSARAAAADLAEPLADGARDRARRLAERHVPLSGDFDVFDARDIFDDLDQGRA